MRLVGRSRSLRIGRSDAVQVDIREVSVDLLGQTHGHYLTDVQLGLVGQFLLASSHDPVVSERDVEEPVACRCHILDQYVFQLVTSLPRGMLRGRVCASESGLLGTTHQPNPPHLTVYHGSEASKPRTSEVHDSRCRPIPEYPFGNRDTVSLYPNRE